MKKIFNKIIFGCFFAGLASQYAAAQVRTGVIGKTNRQAGQVVQPAVQPADPSVIQAANPGIINTIMLSDGKQIRTNFVSGNGTSPGDMVAVQKVVVNNAGSKGMMSMHNNGNAAADKTDALGNTVHNVNATNNQSGETKNPDGSVCVSGTTSFSINSTDQLPIGSREFIQRFKPGTVFDLTQEAALMNGISVNRKPITLYCDVTGESVTVSNPTETALNTAVAGLLKSLPSRNSTIISAKSEEISSEEEFALKISGGAKCAYGSVQGLFDFKNSKSAFRFLFDFNEESAVISADNKGDAFFTDAGMQGNSNYGFVKAATYGRRILVCVETKKYSSSEKEQLDITFSNVFASGNASLSAEQKSMYSNCKITVFAIGGSNKDAAILPVNSSDPALLKQTLQNFLVNYDNTMLLPIKVNMSDLKGVPKRTETSGNVPYVKCFNPAEQFRLTVKSVEVTAISAGLRKTYRMYGSFWIKGYDKNGNEIPDAHGRNPQINVASASNYIGVDEHKSYNFNTDLSREFEMDTRYQDARIVLTTALDDNGDFTDSEQRGDFTLYIKDILAALAASQTGNTSNDMDYSVTGGGFSLKITFSISK